MSILNRFYIANLSSSSPCWLVRGVVNTFPYAEGGEGVVSWVGVTCGT
jgi:hypothetical protein